MSQSKINNSIKFLLAFSIVLFFIDKKVVGSERSGSADHLSSKISNNNCKINQTRYKYELMCSGNNQFGQLGNGTNVRSENFVIFKIPMEVERDPKLVEFIVGKELICVRSELKNVYCAGSNVGNTPKLVATGVSNIEVKNYQAGSQYCFQVNKKKWDGAIVLSCFVASEFAEKKLPIDVQDLSTNSGYRIHGMGFKSNIPKQNEKKLIDSSTK